MSPRRSQSRRAIETEYLAAIGDAVSLDDWTEIIERAVADAKQGDAKSRDWLTRHLLGSKPGTLADIAAREISGVTVDAEIQLLAQQQEAAEECGAVLDRLLAEGTRLLIENAPR